MDKRGLNGIIVSALMIAFVFSAGIIFWKFILPIFAESSEEFNTGILTTYIEVDGRSVEVDEAKKNVSMNVKRKAGEGNIGGFRVVLEDENGNSFSKLFSVPLEVFEVESIIVDYGPSNLVGVEAIKVFPILITKSGKEQSGTASIYEVKPPVCGDGLCKFGENCVADSGGCNSAPVCYSGAGTCSNGCVFANVSFGATDPGRCDVSTGCGYALCVCNGAGSCINKQKRVFLTGGSWVGNLGGLNGGDEKCQTVANLAGLTGTWKAWLSSESSDASSRVFQFSYPYVLLNGTVVADNWNDLKDGTLDSAISLTEFGANVIGASVWTGTNPDGSLISGNTCESWTLNSGNGRGGNPSSTSSTWTSSSSNGCGASLRLYCFEQ